MGPDREDAGLRGEDWAVLERLRPATLFQKDRIIYQQGEIAGHFYYLRAGKVKIFLSSPDGVEKTLMFHEPGGVFGEAAFFDMMPRMSSARAVEDCQLVMLDAAAAMEAFQHEPQLAMRLLRYLARTVRMLSSQVDNITFLQADRRIAQVLVRLARPCGDGGFAVRCTHEEIASLAGTSRITASRVLGAFCRSGWIRTGYRAIGIVEFPALSGFASGQDGVGEEPGRV